MLSRRSPTLNPSPTYHPNCSYYCREEAKADGLYLEHVFGAVLRNVTIEFEAPRLDWFGACVAMDPVTKQAGVHGLSEVRCINGPAPPS